METDRRFRRLIENITDTVTVVDASGEPVWTSASGRNDLGYEVGFWGGADLFALVHPDDRTQIEASLGALVGDPDTPVAGEVRLRRTSGDYSFIGFDATNRLDDPDIEGIVITARNIDALVQARTERERSDIELRKALDTQAQLIAGVSHEMRTPIHAIGGLSELVLSSSGLSVEHRHQVQTIAREAEALRVLLDELLDLSKIGAGQLELSVAAFSPAVLLDEVAQAHRPNAVKKGLLLSVEIDPSMPRALRGDEFRTRQILMNLCSNAVKYTDEGRIDLRVSMIDELTVVFEVADTGRGVPAEIGSNIFEPYAQARLDDRSMGTGIGLAISARLAEAMGGQLTFESSTSGSLSGTTFRCVIPYQRARRATDLEGLRTPEADAPAPPNAPSNLASLEVLVVDDSSVNRMLAESQLALLGHHATLVNDGADAITAVEHRRFDAVLMDWHMPGVDGLEATRRIRAAGHTDLPIIAVTASALAEDRQKCLAAGMDDYLTKPVSLSDLREILAPWAGAETVSAHLGEPADEPTATQVVDVATVRLLVTDLGGDAVRSLAAAFCSELPLWLSSAQAGIDEPDFAVVRRTAHTLKSTAAMLGAFPLAELSAEIERTIRDDAQASPDAVAALVDRLVSEAPAAAAALSPLIDDIEAAEVDEVTTQPEIYAPTNHQIDEEMLAP